MAKRSAGLLMYRRRKGALELLLVHPGGPFFAGKDAGVWTVPKGETEPGEEPLASAIREFGEETGFASAGPYAELGSIRQTGGKIVTAWAFEGDCDASALRSNTCELEYPPRSGKRIVIAEVDRGAWFDVEQARAKLKPAQWPFVERLQTLLDSTKS